MAKPSLGTQNTVVLSMRCSVQGFLIQGLLNSSELVVVENIY